MSNLNVNNIDVQRMINVFKELQWKMELCSCLTMNTFDKIKSKKEYIEKEFGDKVYNLLETHYDHMTQFKSKHLVYKEDKKEIEKQDDDLALEGEEEVVREVTKEKQNLNEIEENTSKETSLLAKSTRNLYREFKNNLRLLDFLKELRSDPEIIRFSEDMTIMIQTDISRSKMTEEEEISEKDLNEKLTMKIKDMENQLNEKNNKLRKLKEDKSNYKGSCMKQLEEIKNEIDGLKNSTSNFLNTMEKDINNYLNDMNKKHKENINEYTSELKAKGIEFKEEREKNHREEKSLVDQVAKNEADLDNHIRDNYDVPLQSFKQQHMEKLKEDQEKAKEIQKLNTKLQKHIEKNEAYEIAHKDYVDKVTQMEMEKKMLAFSCGSVQSAFRGFLTRKTLRKKFAKILTGLRKVKPAPVQPTKPVKGGKGK